MLSILGGCGPTIVLPGDEGPTEEMTVGTTMGSSATAALPTPPPDPSTGLADDSGDGPSDPGGFLPFNDLGPDQWCDLFSQNCPPGLKCMPYADDGGQIWNAAGCFPVVEDPDEVGEPCTIEGNGIDTCDIGMICWDADPHTQMESCVSMCNGHESDSICTDPDTFCAQDGTGLLALCLPTCDPLNQDCPDDLGCYPFINRFTCISDASGPQGAPGQTCQSINTCDPGSACVSPEFVPGCEAPDLCCSAFCPIGEPPTACLPGQVCVPWYRELGDSSYEDVGLCGLPEA